MSKAQVYSYTRFSDPKQAEGHSAERQIDYAQRWAAERGFVLDASLSMRDEGLSAYHQVHVKHGALGVFLRAIEDGRIAPGSVLIVEGLDRLSRAEPIQAQAQLAQIINAGITVVTASDNKEYSRAQLKASPMDLVYSLLVMIRAHEESDTKSTRVKAAIRRQCEGWIAGTFRGVIRNGKDPAWVRWNGTAFELIEERAAAVRLALSLYQQGHSGVSILKKIEAAGYPEDSISTAASHLYKTIRRIDLIGDRVLRVGDEEFRLAGYYPPLITLEEWQALQGGADTRTKRVGKGEVPGVITGMRVTTCGYCGGAMVGQNSYTRGHLTRGEDGYIRGERRRRDNGVPDSNRRLWCVAMQRASGCNVKGSCSVVPIERAILNYCADQFRLDGLLAGSDRSQALRGQLAALREKVAGIDSQLNKITDALLSEADAAPLIFARRARELETTQAALQQQIKNVEGELAREASNHKDPEQASAWAAIAEGTLALDYDSRVKMRSLVAATFSKIVIWHSGNPASTTHIDMLLIAKGGASRMLIVDRKTGEWEESETVSSGLR